MRPQRLVPQERSGQQGKQPALSRKALRAFRVAKQENQTQFWSRFGVTQSRGSRFELGMDIPPPVSILLRLYLDGIIDDRDLRNARSDKAS